MHNTLQLTSDMMFNSPRKHCLPMARRFVHELPFDEGHCRSELCSTSEGKWFHTIVSKLFTDADMMLQFFSL